MAGRPATLSVASPALRVAYTTISNSKPDLLSNRFPHWRIRSCVQAGSNLRASSWRQDSSFILTRTLKMQPKRSDSQHSRLFSSVSGGGNGMSGGGNNRGGDGNGMSGGSNFEGGRDGDSRKTWSFVSWYLELLSRYPVLTKAITSAILTLAGDLICQFIIDQVPTLDIKRTFTFTLLGLVLVGPTLHYWYLYLSKLVTLSGGSGAFVRLALDQFIFSPIFIGVFLSALVSLEGRPSDVVPKLKQEWFSAVIANWQLWIPFQFLNFRFVPQPFQVLAANVVALVWNVILSFKAHKAVI